MKSVAHQNLLDSLEQMSAQELRRLLGEHLTRQKLGLYWERNAIEHDKALNANVVLPRLVPEWSHTPAGCTQHRNLIIEGDNFDSLRLLKATHAGKVKVIYIDPPYNTGNKDWVYNDAYIGKNDRWRHSLWLEFLYRRLTLARDLLRSDGVIMVSINDENRSRLELLMDEVFPGRRVGSFVWRSRTGGNDTKGAFFSDNHEHVLVYANAGFRFSGDEKSYSMYKYQEGDRIYRLSDLTSPKNAQERPNTYYPLRDPKTDIWYPCNPSRVWAYATKDRLKENQKIRVETMEELIDLGKIWFPPNQRVEVFSTPEDLKNAIRKNEVPMSGNSPLLYEGMPELDFWIGKNIGYGRPAFKRFKEGLKNENQPISSWLTPKQEQATVIDGMNMPIVGTTEEGSKALRELMRDKAFPYPKPPSLINALLSQTTSEDDIVLDFFSGSGTTAQVVLELNSEDQGNRRFILCSSTEATSMEPEKNLCRDVCAERVRRAIQSIQASSENTMNPEPGFAYLQIEKLDHADVSLDASAVHIATLLGMRYAATVPTSHQTGAVRLVAKGVDWLMVLCPKISEGLVEELIKLKVKHNVERLVVYAHRPKALASLLMERGVDAQVYAIRDALIQGQGRRT